MKIRHIDFYPDEFIAGTASMSTELVGAYWQFCTLQYSIGRALPLDGRLLCDTYKWHPDNWDVYRNELVRLGKIKRTRYGWSNPRVEAEIKKVNKRVVAARSNGKLGGRPRRDGEEKPPGDSGLEKPSGGAKPKANHQPLTNNHQPRESADADSQKRARDWEAFWETYPHKVAKTTARVAFFRALHKVDFETMLVALGRYIRTKPPDRQYMNPSTWLNQERWNDQPAQTELFTGPTNARPAKPAKPTVADRLKAHYDRNPGLAARVDPGGAAAGGVIIDNDLPSDRRGG